MLIADTHTDEMPKAPHCKKHRQRRTLVERGSRLACANKPKALSTSIKRGAANSEEFARRACSFVKQNSTLPFGSESQTDLGCRR